MPGHRLPSLKSRRETGGFSIQKLAKDAVITDELIQVLESGGNCRPEVTQRLLDALAPPVAITDSSVANPSVITTATHRFQTGDSVTISGHAASTPSINSTFSVTRVNDTSFTIPVNVTDGGTGGTATIQPASLGIVRLD